MSFPYLTDVVNAAFGVQWHLPIPVFGLVVASAILLAAWIFRLEVRRYEKASMLPSGTEALITDLVFWSVMAGLVGAKIFHLLEYPDALFNDPVNLIFSRAGFSIYGCSCFGTVVAAMFLRRRRTPIVPMLDAAAPAMMLGYGVGRLGCQLSGDGDWGIPANLAMKPEWLPDWLWAQTYENNIAGISIVPPGVYPTPLYEAGMALVLFVFLWMLRTHRQRAGFLFSIYLVCAGFERLLIEKIRINAQFELFDLVFTQAEAISLLLIVGGGIGALVTLRSRRLLPRAAFTCAVLTALSACMRL